MIDRAAAPGRLARDILAVDRRGAYVLDMIARPLVLSALVPLALALADGGACTPAQNRQDVLLRSVHEYNDGVRWKKYDHVTHHLSAEEARRFAARAGTFGDDYEMADEEVVSIEPKNDDRTRADVTVNFSWYDRRRALVRKAVILEEWAFTDGQWLCEKQRRLQGDGFPLVPEAEPPAGAPTGPR
jgi:hypothetical protein